MSNFHVGQKVVCIGGKAKTKRFFSVTQTEAQTHGAIYPTIGAVYTVRDVFHWPDGTTLLLEEVSNRHLIGWKGGMIEPGFPAKCFRPVVERKTDISVFTDMLNTENSKVLA